MGRWLERQPPPRFASPRLAGRGRPDPQPPRDGLSRAEPSRARPAGRGPAAEQEAAGGEGTGRGHGGDRLRARHQVRGGREGDPEPAQKWFIPANE